ncbi:DUF2306 domain-containing protein [bacterium]|nr:DUF2306 domain-containing protein [bacterium]
MIRTRPIFLFLLAWYAIGTGVAAMRFVTTDASIFDPLYQFKYEANIGLVMTHGASAIAVLLLGLVVFAVPMHWSRRFHRIAGRLYAVLLVVAGVTGFRMALMAYGGLPSVLGLGSLSILWLWTLWRGISAARTGHFSEHRAWMIRNYGLTFAAVLLRALVRKAGEYDLPYEIVYPVATWLSWAPALVIIELWLRRQSVAFYIDRLKAIYPSIRRLDQVISKVSPLLGTTTFTSK